MNWATAHTHTHTEFVFSQTDILIFAFFCDTSLTSKTLFCALPLALTRLCMSQLPEPNNDRQNEWKPVKLLSCISFSLHSFYFPTKLYKHFLFTLLLQLRCFAASVRWGCLKSHNYVLKQQTYTDTQTLPQTSMVVVNYLFLWDCRGQIYGPISPVFGKPSSKGITSKSLLLIEMLCCLAWKPADSKNWHAKIKRLSVFGPCWKKWNKCMCPCVVWGPLQVDRRCGLIPATGLGYRI